LQIASGASLCAFSQTFSLRPTFFLNVAFNRLCDQPTSLTFPGLTRAGFNEEFVGDAWEQWNSADFNKETDLLGLIVGRVREAAIVDSQLHSICSCADRSATPDAIVCYQLDE
jgi:hypothetical protein